MKPRSSEAEWTRHTSKGGKPCNHPMEPEGRDNGLGIIKRSQCLFFFCLMLIFNFYIIQKKVRKARMPN